MTSDAAALRDATDLVIMAVPAAAMRGVARRIRAHVADGAVVLSVAKGIEHDTLQRMTEVLAAELAGPSERLAAMSGPNLAVEIARGLPASSVVGAVDPEIGARVVGLVGTREFRLYRNRDLIGVELCGALKNIIAIAAGAVDGLGFGDNGKSAIITRGLAEMTRLGMAAGANPMTFAGLAGIGDVMATCASPLSRNHRLGVELANGRSWPEIEPTLPGVAEGAYTVDSALAMAARLGVEMPDRPGGPQRPVRGQERQALPDRPAVARVEGRAGRLRGALRGRRGGGHRETANEEQKRGGGGKNDREGGGSRRARGPPPKNRRWGKVLVPELVDELQAKGEAGLGRQRRILPAGVPEVAIGGGRKRVAGGGALGRPRLPTAAVLLLDQGNDREVVGGRPAELLEVSVGRQLPGTVLAAMLRAGRIGDRRRERLGGWVHACRARLGAAVANSAARPKPRIKRRRCMLDFPLDSELYPVGDAHGTGRKAWGSVGRSAVSGGPSGILAPLSGRGAAW